MAESAMAKYDVISDSINNSYSKLAIGREYKFRFSTELTVHYDICLIEYILPEIFFE